MNGIPTWSTEIVAHIRFFGDMAWGISFKKVSDACGLMYVWDVYGTTYIFLTENTLKSPSAIAEAVAR